MTKTTITACGDCATLCLSESILSALNLRVGDSLEIEVDNGRIVLTPNKEPVSPLDRLMHGVTEDNIHRHIDFGPVAGKYMG
ncbi:AbrB/MazE/SpoVT family DNA-binding domain-containing protein [Rosenbergiella collisarenosi]|uniref:AbrB/MazE/SpoVT family DNA-binding domain-containing protein n=1 Tax=Rosenbergiella collisarenosi TaxID=1544695 RepID=UPI001BD9F748|nr:AbrB/MazE/SpoVT family DNA-binding domain-containing protein [Rosenbergiella collisarenosi]